MEKTIKICNEELKVKSSLFTIIDYKNTFGSDLFNDATRIGENKNNDVSSIIQTLFQILYIFNKPYSKKSFDEFLDGFDFSILSDSKALEDITNAISELLGSVKDGTKRAQNP